MKYTNIIFDLGNVLVKLNEEATMKAFEELGMASAAHIREDAEAMQLFRTMGVGRISNEAFFNGFRRIAHSNATDAQITTAANAMLASLPDKKKLQLLELRKAGYRTYLLSNTNDLHWQYCVDHLFPMGHHTVTDYFDRIFLSQEMHLEKPSDEIFQTVISQANIVPGETLFIDDLEANCMAAERNGIHAFQNKEFDDWLQLF